MTVPFRYGPGRNIGISGCDEAGSYSLPSRIKIGIRIQNDAKRTNVALLQADTNTLDQGIFPAVGMDMFYLPELSLTADVLDDMFVIRPFDHQYEFGGHPLPHLDLVTGNDLQFLFREQGRG
jgi:hypothetical protein